jgi:hypothetical protein
LGRSSVVLPEVQRAGLVLVVAFVVRLVVGFLVRLVIGLIVGLGVVVRLGHDRRRHLERCRRTEPDDGRTHGERQMAVPPSPATMPTHTCRSPMVALSAMKMTSHRGRSRRRGPWRVR